MSLPTSNVNISSDTFGGVIDRVNDLSFALSNIIVTVAANTVGGSTTGNGHVSGIFGATTLVATTVRGGNVVSSANLTFTSNTIFNGALLQSSANVNVNNANTTINATNFTLNGTTATINANVNLTALSTFSANANPNANGVALGNATARWNLWANSVNTLNFEANTFSANSVAVGSIVELTSYSNNNLGATGSKVIFSLPLATYRSARVDFSAQTPAGSYQSGTINLIHNNSDVYYTSSGIVYSNTQFFTLDGVINGSNVDIRATPTTANVAIKAFAQLIKV